MNGCEILCAPLCAPLTINTCRDDTASVACPLATGEQSFQPEMLQGDVVAQDADRGRGTGLDGDEHCLIGEEAVMMLSEKCETLSKS